jgi:hypothetical protein
MAVFFELKQMFLESKMEVIRIFCFYEGYMILIRFI